MEKVNLPTKTKIAAWWMMAVGVLGIGIAAYFIVTSFMRYAGESASYFLLALLLFGFYSSPSLFLLKKKKWAWWGGVFSSLAVLIILNLNPISLIFWAIVIVHLPQCFLMGDCYIGEMMGISGNVLGLLLGLLIFQIPLMVPLLLLLLDRKNFWKIAS